MKREIYDKFSNEKFESNTEADARDDLLMGASVLGVIKFANQLGKNEI